MLLDIRIRGLGVIADAVLTFGPGLTVVTGETGAGKTMVVTGLALLFGGRADTSRLRPGVDAASVEGRISVPCDGAVAQAVIDAGGDLDADRNDGDPADGEPADSEPAVGDRADGAGTEDGSAILILRRVLNANGRSRAVAGGASVPASLLVKLGDELVTVHGQSDQFRLTRATEQRATLDRYAGIDVRACRTAHRQWQDAERGLLERQHGARELAREADMLRAGVQEITAVAPRVGEDRELAELSVRLQSGEALRVAARTARDALSADSLSAQNTPPDVQSLLASAAHALQLVSGTDSALDGLATRVSVVMTDIDDLAAAFAEYADHLDTDPERLSAVFSRRAALQALTRKYGADLDEVLHWAESARQRLAETDTSAEVLAELAARRDRARAAYAAAARAVSVQRRQAATELSHRITAELAGLGMPAATVQLDVRPRSVLASQPSLTAAEAGETGVGAGETDRPGVGAGAEGFDEVELTLRAHPDAPALPIQRGASGGELSRVMLAIEVVLAGTDPVATMVFDEVDAGVGGRAAVEVGRRLAQLARSHQVLVVTHLAQVAAFADHHLVVDKSLAAGGIQAAPGDSTAAGRTAEAEAAGVTHSDIRAVTGEDRLAELARMLAGDNSAVAREHAAELVANAAREGEPLAAQR